jgi:hypothetical protein
VPNWGSLTIATTNRPGIVEARIRRTVAAGGEAAGAASGAGLITY